MYVNDTLIFCLLIIYLEINVYSGHNIIMFLDHCINRCRFGFIKN